MASTSNWIVGIVSIVLGSFVLKSRTAECISIPPSTHYYGQDGPWGAVNVRYGGYPGAHSSDGNQWESLDLIPGGLWTSFVISPASCKEDLTALCGIGGTFDPTNVEQTVDDRKIYFEPSNEGFANSGVHFKCRVFAQTINVGATAGRAGYNIYNTSTTILDSLSLTVPSNKNDTAVEVGFLALGGGTQAWHLDPMDVWTLPGYFYNQSLITSFTYTLHVGSAKFEYPVSLVFGGYDQGRMIGTPTVYDGNNTALLDIGIGVHTGNSPFKFPSKDKLLIDSSGAKAHIQVTPDSQGPYLSLPKETCDAIADQIPVTLDPSGYYLWDTDDPKYQEIVSSPAYLSFTFSSSPANGALDNVIIKVPFILLNLTLGPVLSGKAKPVPYFPCMPFNPSDGIYYLGRAFLQAALVGRRWDQDTAWLAQAPGPGSNRKGLGQALKDIQQGNDILEPLSGDKDDQFGSSWLGYWQPLLDSSAPDGSSSNVSSSNGSTSDVVDHQGAVTGLSTGAKAGIGSGAGILGLLAIAGSCMCMWKRRKSSSASQAKSLHIHTVENARNDATPLYSDVDPVNASAGYGMGQMPQGVRLQELSSTSEMSELPGIRDPRELDAGRL